MKKFFHTYQIMGLVIFLLSLITLISLITYNKQDLSLFYFDSDALIHNKLGSFGANISALLFYLFGLSAFILIFFGFYLSKIIYNNISFKKEWDVVLGYIILIFSFCSLLIGGVLGNQVHRYLFAIFKNNNLVLIFNICLLWGALILITRFAIVNSLRPVTLLLKKIIMPVILPVKKINFFTVNTVYAQEQDIQDIIEEDFWPEQIIEREEHKYILPDLSMFTAVETVKENTVIKALDKQARTLEEKLKHFGVNGQVVAIAPGPVVTLFEYQPSIDTKISKIIALEDDLSMALQATSIRIIAPIPGKSVVGFEVANKIRKSVFFANMVHSHEFKNFSGHLPLVLGEDTLGNKVVSDLAKMPHLLVAGSTGSGKSVALNSIISGLLCKCTLSDLKLILIDPKRLEFAQYADIAHLLFPIVTNPKSASPVLRWVVQEMEARYTEMAQAGVKNIFEYNELSGVLKKPFIIVMIDELADLMMTAGKEIEDLIIRIAQMARASGIHMIVATQRPSADVITGLIKINFPCRIAFRVASKVDSRIILDNVGADKLLGKGDLLLLDSGSPYLKRVHGAFIETEEVLRIVNHVRLQAQAKYLDLTQINLNNQNTLDQDDELYNDIVSFLNEIDEVSISLLQRRFRIGYNRSARIIEILEAKGHIFPMDGGKTRKVVKT